jgi:molybdopterin-guanine dinucleotide biosynthesis protein A
MPMYMRVLDTLAAVSPHVNVSLANQEDLILELDTTERSIAVIHDRRLVGPLGGIEAVLSARKSDQLVLAVDLPALKTRTLLQLSEHALRSDADVFVARARESGRIQPLCGVWSARLLSDITDYLDAGRRSVHGLLDSLSIAFMDVPESELININRPRDLDLLT